MKKKIALLLTVCLTFGVLSGCGTKSAKTEDGKLVIDFCTHLNNNENTPEIEGFMKENPDIVVKTEILEGSKFSELLQPRIMSNDEPDVIMISQEMFKNYIGGGWLEDLSDLPIAEQMKKQENITSIFAKDGKYYGVPVSGGYSVHPMYYNKKIFDKLNITPPKTEEEFYSVCEAIKQSGVEPVVCGGADAWTIGSLCNPMITSEALTHGDDYESQIVDGKLKYSDFSKNTLDFLKKLVDNGYIGKSALTMKYEQSVQYFADGKAAMIAQGLWVPELPQITEADPETLELGTFMNPVLARDGEGKVRVDVAPDRILIISKNAANKEACKKFVEYFTRDDVLTEYLNRQNLDTMFTHLELKKSEVLQDFYKDLLDPENTSMLSIKYEYNMPKAVSSATLDAFQNILAGAGADDELAKIDAAFDNNRDKAEKR